jgi:hypothetical protein
MASGVKPGRFRATIEGGDNGGTMNVREDLIN